MNSTYRVTHTLCEVLNIGFEENVSVHWRKANLCDGEVFNSNRFYKFLEEIGDPDRLTTGRRSHEKSVANIGAKLMF